MADAVLRVFLGNKTLIQNGDEAAVGLSILYLFETVSEITTSNRTAAG